MKTRLIVGLLLAGTLVPAFSQNNEPKAPTLDELLKLVQQGRVSESEEHRKREQEFLAKKSEQEQLLRDIKNKLAAEERRGQQLEKTFEGNELRTAELTETLNRRLGSLKELFGVLQQVAGDTRGLFDSSITNIQYPDRSAFLTELARKMGTTSKLATIEEIERLWFELQREMTESGNVARFNATVVAADGRETQMDVVRIGLFNVVADGKYLQYAYNSETERGRLSELPRQPQGRYLSTTSDLLKAKDGLVGIGIDPARGSILALLVQSPSLRERIDQGGLIGYLIIVLGVLGLLIALERFIVLGNASRKVKSQLKGGKARKDNPLGRVLMVYEENREVDRETLELKMGEAILKEAPALQRALLFLKIISVVAPLMGLLGTVTGMINTFQAITLYGTGDPTMMASGISQALVTTVLGLCVAIPIVLLHTLVSGRSRNILHILEEQSAGIVAEHAEKQSGEAHRESDGEGGEKDASAEPQEA